MRVGGAHLAVAVLCPGLLVIKHERAGGGGTPLPLFSLSPSTRMVRCSGGGLDCDQLAAGQDGRGDHPHYLPFYLPLLVLLLHFGEVGQVDQLGCDGAGAVGGVREVRQLAASRRWPTHTCAVPPSLLCSGVGGGGGRLVREGASAQHLWLFHFFLSARRITAHSLPLLSFLSVPVPFLLHVDLHIALPLCSLPLPLCLSVAPAALL
mmetsp:Transcript_39566/g.101616  ORF Transcript_39566/g.101616 Transcript_39566/m.101616 type:complete len:207 (-) Transcript_39566:193-813(-)